MSGAHEQDLRLKDKSRELVHKGPLKRRGGTRDEIADLMGFLFDHALLLVKPKAAAAKGEQLRVYRRVSRAAFLPHYRSLTPANPARAASSHVAR
jgi:hypothetical protein